MPFVSRSQARWAFTPAGRKALGGPEKVKEWADSTNYGEIPERKTPQSKAPKKRFLDGQMPVKNHA